MTQLMSTRIYGTALRVSTGAVSSIVDVASDMYVSERATRSERRKLQGANEATDLVGLLAALAIKENL